MYFTVFLVLAAFCGAAVAQVVEQVYTFEGRWIDPWLL